jgi:hypothetical protein
MGSNQSKQTDPYGSRPGQTSGMFGSSSRSSSFRLAPPRGFVISISVIAQLVLLIVNAIVVIPLVDPSVGGMTLFVYKAKDGREYSLGSCQVEQSKGTNPALPRVDSCASVISEVPLVALCCLSDVTLSVSRTGVSKPYLNPPSTVLSKTCP